MRPHWEWYWICVTLALLIATGPCGCRTGIPDMPKEPFTDARPETTTQRAANVAVQESIYGTKETEK